MGRSRLGFVIVVCLLAAACGDSASTSDPAVIHSDREVRNATLRLEVQTCKGPDRQRATAVVLERSVSAVIDTTADPDERGNVSTPTTAATVAHTFIVDGALSVRDFAVYDADGNRLGAQLTFIDPDTDVALLTLADEHRGLMIGAFVEPDPTSRVVLYPESESTPTLAEISVVRQTTATLDGVGARRALELAGPIESGDSGAPVVDDRGRVIGVVFATSTSSETSWAIAASEFEEAMAQPSEPVELTCE